MATDPPRPPPTPTADSPHLPPAPTSLGDPASLRLPGNRPERAPSPDPGIADDSASAPVPGVASKVERDSDLASHPSVLVYHNFTSKQYIRDSFVGSADAARPSLEAHCEIIDVHEYGVKGVRLWAVYTKGGVSGNEKIVSWWCTAEPKLGGTRARPWHRAYGDGYAHLFVRYLLKVGEDVATGAGELAGKLPGMTGTYNIQAQGIAPPSPSFNAFALWEARMWQGYPTARGYPLGIYYYGVRAPRTHPGIPGVPASPGKFDGMGTPSGTPMTSGYLVPGRWHCIEQQVKLNSVKDAALRAPKSADLNEQMQEMIDNANEDGELRVWLDGALVYESVNVAFRGLDCVRIQSLPFVNIYQGGRGTYPKGPEHYDLCALVAATEYVGPPKRKAESEAAVAAVPAVKQTLGSLAATMAPGTWAELIAEDIDAVIGVGRPGNSEVAVPYANSAPWCPIRKRIVIVGSDHGDAPIRHIEYDDATNKWYLIDRGIGSHQYQQVAVDPYSGDIYQRYGADLYRYTGQTWVSVSAIPFNVSQIASVALAWWSGPYPGAGGHGVLTVYSGNAGTISAYDPTRGAWLARSDEHASGAGRSISRRERVQRPAQLPCLRWRLHVPGAESRRSPALAAQCRPVQDADAGCPAPRRHIQRDEPGQRFRERQHHRVRLRGRLGVEPVRRRNMDEDDRRPRAASRTPEPERPPERRDQLRCHQLQRGRLCRCAALAQAEVPHVGVQVAVRAIPALAVVRRGYLCAEARSAVPFTRYADPPP